MTSLSAANTCPFWAWNGKITKEEIEKQVKVFAQMGYGGFFIHSRTGLETDYLSDEWFELVNFCIEESKKLGLKVYLYDEDRYPSGTCGGRVTKDKRFVRKHLYMAVADEFVGEFYDNIIAVFSVEFDGEYLKSYNKFNAQKGKVLVFYLDYGESSSYFNGSPYVDTLSKAATERFLELTHEKYKDNCKQYFGKDVLGVFSDEVGYGHLFCTNAKNNVVKNKQVPYFTDMFVKFYDKYGYDLKDKLPELFFRKKGESLRKITYQYINLLQETFIETFAKPYSKWCNENGLLFMGHILQEETLSTQTACCGSVMRFYEFMDCPGIDVLRENVRNEWIMKQASSVAKQLGKKFAMAECYGSTGYNVNIERYKKMNDVLSVFDISFMVPHLVWYTMKGRAKRDYPANLFFHNSGFEDASVLQNYFNVRSRYLNNTTPITNVCVISPIESVWAMAHSDAFEDDSFSSKDHQINSVECDFQSTFYALMGKDIDFDYADEGLLEKYCSIRNDEDGVKFVVGNMQYNAVVLYGNRIIRKSTFELLKRFADFGGKVFVKNDTLLSIGFNDVKDCDLDKFINVENLDMLTEKLKPLSRLTLFSDDKIYTNIKKDAEGYLMFAVNSDKVNILETKISIGGEFNVCEVNMHEDIIKDCETIFDGKRTNLNVTFGGGEGKLFKLTKKPIKIPEKTNADFEIIEMPDEFDYSLSSDNVLLMDKAKLYIDGKLINEDYVLSIDSAIRNRFMLEQKKELMCQPYFKRNNELDYDKELCNVELQYSFYAEHIPNKLYLALEQEEEFNIKLNDNYIDKAYAGKYVDDCFTKIEIPKEKVVYGKNTISLLCKYKDCINIEAVYLLGQFAVNIDCKTIVKLPPKLKVGDVTKQGLPFYGDKIIYNTDIVNGIVKVDFKKLNGYSQSAVNGDGEKERACFYPYVTKELLINDKLGFEVCLSRQNTFGPIHNVDKNLAWNGPFTYIDFNDGKFSKEFVLKDQGLLVKPVVYKLKKISI